MKRLLSFAFIFQSCLGWGDVFSRTELIVGNYYLVENESGSYDIGYKLDGGSYVGRNPSDSRVIAYAYNDSLLVMKVEPFNGEAFYYAINMKKDKDVADKEEYQMDRIALKDYENSWLTNLNFHFKEVK